MLEEYEGRKERSMEYNRPCYHEVTTWENRLVGHHLRMLWLPARQGTYGS